MRRLRYKLRKININVKERLHKNKIYFETVLMLSVTIMGVIISGVGLRIDKRNQEISNKQLEILENDREPYFTIKTNTIEQEFKDYDNYYYKKNRYTILNTGGAISGAYLEIQPQIVIYIFNDTLDKNEKYVYLMPELFYGDGIYTLYDEPSKTFTFYGYEGSYYDSLIRKFEKELREKFVDEIVGVLQLNYVDITYVNYENKYFQKRYNFHENQIELEDEADVVDKCLGIMESNNMENIVEETYEKIMEHRASKE